MKEYSTGEAARLIGVSRDTIHSYFRSGAPRPKKRLGNRIAFTRRDIAKLCDWFEAKGIAVTRPDFDAVAGALHSTA